MGLALDEPEKDEKPYPINGIDVLMEEDIKSFADGKLVDYLSSPYGETFTVENPYGAC